jgi:N6-L-threonylcarbamoyladenine synthase
MCDGVLKSNIVSSQLIHQRYGGVVPELASRAHQQLIVPVVDEALRTAGISADKLQGVAVTHGPGLAGALLVGVNFAKAFAYSLGIPFIGVNHMEAHMYANFIDEPKPRFPFLCLIVSGGHTQLVVVREHFQHELLGETLDDAAGEAYDKVGKMLGLGFPGGPAIDKYAAEGDPAFVRFPRSFLNEESYDFSFSGIKTSVLYWLKGHGSDPSQGRVNLTPMERNNLCASFQAAVVDVLVGKTLGAAKKLAIHDVAIAGGVSANSELRRRLKVEANRHGFSLFIPKFEYCTDNAAMIAMIGSLKLGSGVTSTLELNAIPNLAL